MTHSNLNCVSVLLLKQNTREQSFLWDVEWRQSTSYRQIGEIKVASYRSRELSILARNMDAGTIDFIQRPFALVWWKRRCFHLKGNSKKDSLYHNKHIDMLELGCMLPNLVNTCLHRSTHANFCPFTEGHKNWLEKIKEDMVDWPSIVFTCEGVVDITSVRKRRNYAIQVLVLMVVNCIRTQCVNHCHHDPERVVISLQKAADLYNSTRVVLRKHCQVEVSTHGTWL